jgi:hypothetical protein
MRGRPATSFLKETENLDWDPASLDKEKEHSVEKSQNDRKIGDAPPDATPNLSRRARTKTSLFPPR